MSQPDQNAALAANEFEPTDAERQLLDEAAAAAAAAAAEAAQAGTGTGTGAAAAEGAPAAAGAVDGAAAGNAGAAPTDGSAAAADPAAAAAAAAAAANPEPAAVQSPPAAAAAPAHFVPTYTPESRDFNAEISGINQQLVELKAKYKAGDVEDDQYEDLYEQLRDQRSVLERAQDRAEITAQLNQQNSDQSWAYLQRQFLSDPQNAVIAASPLLFSAWATAMEVVVNDAAVANVQLTDWDVLTKAREELVKAGMLGAAAAASQPPAPVPDKPNRAAPINQVPQTLSSVPAAADPSSRATVDAAAEQNIEDLEAYLASKPEAERDRILKDLPGQFADD